MKKLLLIIIVSFATLTSCAIGATSVKYLDSPPSKTKSIVNTLDANSNYIKANEWMVETFNNAESVIQFTDKEAGIVKGKYIMKGAVAASTYAVSQPSFSSIITIRVKDQGSRIEIIPPSGMYSRKYMNVEYGFTPEDFNTSADILMADFENDMLKKSANDNWK
jgi:hypothetical protein